MEPVSTEEGFEIVRRRLFEPITDTDARDAVCKAFAAMYESAGVYLPRLTEPTVLQNTIAAGIETRDFFGYALAKDGDRYRGLKFGGAGAVYLDKDSVLVHPDAAKAQQEADAKTGGTTGGTGGTTGTGTGTGTTGGTTGDGGGTPKPKKVYRRFHGAVELKPASVLSCSTPWPLRFRPPRRLQRARRTAHRHETGRHLVRRGRRGWQHADRKHPRVR